ncbi:chaplin, partial [Streptomyces sp. NPDC051051]|uniref:chaplin n=1 Tax=Streptomyces sp. NPDC051051 TaxID=3155666 RepID=UPI00342EFD19
MRQTLSRGMVAAAAATSILSLYGGSALADSHAGGTARNSPGAVSGNGVEVPLTAPANACGDSVDAAALNPTFGDSCANTSGDEEKDRSHETPSSGGDEPGHGGSESGGEESGYGGSESGEDK